MGFQENKIIIQFLLILAIIFCILAMVLPMNGIAEENEESAIDFYIWGMRYIKDDEWLVYLTSLSSTEDTVDSSSSSDEELSPEMTVLVILMLLMFTIFPICIIAIIIALFAIRNVGRKKSCLSLVSAIMIIFSFIIEVAFIMYFVGLINENISSIIKIGITWSFGTVFMIISFVLFLISYFMQLSLYTPSGVPYVQQHQPGYQIPQQQPYQQNYRVPPPPQQPYQQSYSSDVVFCPNCRKKVEKYMNFCDECGYRLQ